MPVFKFLFCCKIHKFQTIRKILEKSVEIFEKIYYNELEIRINIIILQNNEKEEEDTYE